MKRGGPLQRKTPLRQRKLTERGRAILAGTHPRIPITIDLEEAGHLPLGIKPKAPPRAVMALARAPATPAPKEGRYISEAWRRAVADLPCVFCGEPSQAAHRNEGKGMGLKTHDCLTAALCPREHAEIDQGKDMTRDERRARMDRAIVLTLAELVLRGRVVLA